MDTAQRLRDAGLKATKPRQLVLDAFTHWEGHHSVDELVAHLRARGDALPRGSVYGIVEDLVHSGLVQLAHAGPGAALYELFRHEHSHFVCQRCQAIFDVPTEAVSLPPMEFAASVSSVQLVIQGVCQSCLRQS